MYTKIEAVCVDQTLQITSLPPLASGGENEVTLHVEFDDSWASAGKLAVFYRDESKVYQVVLENDSCTVPREVYAESGIVCIGVVGIVGAVVRTTDVVPVKWEKGAATSVTGHEPLPDIYKQILTAYGELGAEIDAERAERKAEVAVERARIDNLTKLEDGSTTGDAELADIRVGADGTTYDTAGAAVRGQTNSVSARVDVLSMAEKFDLTYVDGKYNNAAGSISTASGWKRSEPIYISAPARLCVRTSGYDVNVAAISLTNAEGTTNKPCVIADGSAEKWYTLDVTEDGYYSVSGPSTADILVYVQPFTGAPDSERYAYLVASLIKVGVVGDSLASGACVSNEDGTAHYRDIYEHSWGQFMARRYGLACVNLSRGGMTAADWLTDAERGLIYAQKPENLCNAYIIGLGVNDTILGTGYTGTAADINPTDPAQNANTFCGNYGKIISHLKAIQPKCKIFVLTLPATDNVSKAYNEAIRAVAALYDGCYCIDLEGDGFYRTGFISGAGRYGHYNSVAYNAMAGHLAGLIGGYIGGNPEEFGQLEFIGTDYAWQ